MPSYLARSLYCLHDSTPMEKQRTTCTQYPCDQCRLHKVRCNYCVPCDRCEKRGLSCTSNSARRKRGPRPGWNLAAPSKRKPSNRLEVDGDSNVDETTGDTTTPSSLPTAFETENGPSPQPARSTPGQPAVTVETQDASHMAMTVNHESPAYARLFEDCCTFDEFAKNILTSSTASRFPPGTYDEAPTPANRQLSLDSTAYSQSGLENVISPQSDGTSFGPVLDTLDLVSQSVDLFFKHLYPTYPVLDEIQVRSWCSGSHQSSSTQMCMLWAMCAVTLVHVDAWPKLSFQRRTILARGYIKSCLRERTNFRFSEKSSFEDVLSSLFIAIAYFELRCRTSSWFYVREAITLAIAAGLHEASANASIGFEERVRQQRCYALLFITERGASILDDFPVSILVAPNLVDEVLYNEPASTALGLRRLCELFTLLDFQFVSLWNDRSPQLENDDRFAKFAALQDHLRQPIDLQDVSDIQRADILVTQQWLRLVFWQAALRQGLISMGSGDPAFAYDFPMEIASSLCEVVRSLPPVAFQVHGLGIVSLPLRH